MSDAGIADTVWFPSWAEFLANTPPGRLHPVVGLVRKNPNFGNSKFLESPEIEIFCESEQCSATMTHDGKVVHGDDSALPEDGLAPFLLQYICRHCRVRRKTIAGIAMSDGGGALNGQAAKLGEWPPFGPHVPSRTITLIRPDRELFLQGRRAESQGMGIGAFAYYRRVVENQKGRLFDEIIKVLKRIGSADDLVAELEHAKQQTQFTAAVDSIKAALPESLFVMGKNPLTLLHGALSRDLHAGTDAEALANAQAVRVVLVELAERMGQVLKDNRELADSVKLLSAKPPGRPADTTT